jgi:hypothetical protein
VTDSYTQGVSGMIGMGRLRQSKEHAHHFHHLFLAGFAISHHRPLDLLRRVFEDLTPRLRTGEQSHSPSVSHRQSGTDIDVEEQSLHCGSRRAMTTQKAAYLPMYPLEPLLQRNP